MDLVGQNQAAGDLSKRALKRESCLLLLEGINFRFMSCPHNPRLRTVTNRWLAQGPQCGHYACMSVQITIRDVPEKVRDELAARAALQGKSMQEYLHSELRRMVARPSIDAWLQQVRRRKRTAQSQVSTEQILKNRDADRR